MTYYQGWNYAYNPAHPVTGRWRATQNGVGMGAGTEAQLLRMIDVRNIEARDARAKREAS